MKLPAIVAIGMFASASAFAQQQQAPDPASIQSATEQMLMEQIRSHREWRAAAIAKDEIINKQANQIGVLQKEVAAARPKAAEETPPK